jgi:hypothetical protein
MKYAFPCHLILLHFLTRAVLRFREEYNVVSCIVARLFPASPSLLPLRRKYCVFPNTLFYKIPASAIPCMRETKLRPHVQTTCKSVFLYEYF